MPWLYWTAASWGADLSLAPNQLDPRRRTRQSCARCCTRAKALNDTWENGAIYEGLIAFDGLPPLLGGSPAAARADFDKAMQLSERKVGVRLCRAGVDVTDAAEKKRLLEQALAIDVEHAASRGG